MAKWNSSNIRIQFDRSDATTLTNMSSYITEFNGINIEAMLQESHTFGDSWVEKLFAGLNQIGDVTLKGFYDDTATTGPNAIFNDVGNVATTGTGLRTLEITWDSVAQAAGSRTFTVETIIKAYNRLPSRGGLTMFEAVLTCTGAPTTNT